MTSKKYLQTNTPEELAKSLGLDKKNAIEWQLRYSITQQIIKVFQYRPMTITELAKKSQTSRARITRIIKGDSLGISLDVLVRILGACGQTIKISYSKAS
ncbi:MAG: XRE family transcriptional regulator [Pseudomonadota bacterium]